MGIFDFFKKKKKVVKEEKTPEPKETKKNESNLGEQYYDLEETLFHENSPYHEEYGFIKTLLERLKSGEVSNNDNLSSYIKDHHKKYEGGALMVKTELYKQLENLFTVFLEDWETKKETNFLGFEDVEQYHSLSQSIVTELGNLLQEKIMKLGE